MKITLPLKSTNITKHTKDRLILKLNIDMASGCKFIQMVEFMKVAGTKIKETEWDLKSIKTETNTLANS